MREKSVRLAIYSDKFQYGLDATAASGASGDGGGSDVGIRIFLISCLTKTSSRNKLESMYYVHIKRFLPIGTISVRIIVDNSTTHTFKTNGKR